MRTFGSKLLIGLSLLAGSIPAHGSDFHSSAQGTTSGSFLKLAVDARAVGMGEAYTAVADDAGSMYWNPAAMRRVESKSILAMHAPYIEQSHFNYASYVQSAQNSSLGFSFQHFSAGDIAQRDTTGAEAGNFTPTDWALGLGYARDLSGFKIGVTGKYIQSKIVDTAQTQAIDIGLLSPSYFRERLDFGATISNLGGKLKYDDKSESLPLLIRTGAAYTIMRGWITALDVNFPKDNQPYAALGTEATWENDTLLWSARAGYNTRTMGDVDGITGASFGMGVQFRTLRFDYAIVPFGSMATTHRISLGCDF